ncbi:pirin family protein [Psychroflexus lacisalsi]|uniref:Pirin family protein n=1 Tax=Psychroflexus lacisalsi TaxID=503928 RepID=A0ABP3VM82_9FLAO|nr:pirin family protein [Psychroflexus lacisalsi]MBZ9620617.1 pirin family protein [Psychroflexus lacisalsi]
MKAVLHTANSRGHANHGWLDSHHSFSFAGYFNPERMNFGVLRVLNDDIVAPSMGFGTHGHQNMEIVSIPLEGDLKHKDDTGRETIIKAGDIQVMSAGTGIQHSEFNYSDKHSVNFLQIWIVPNQQNVTPRYDQISIDTSSIKNKFQQILSPNKDDDGIWIYQDAWFHIGEFDTHTAETYQLKNKENGVYLFLLEGEVEIGEFKLSKRDAIGITETDKIKINIKANSKLLIIEVPYYI